MIDIALATDRNEEKIRIFRLPDMTPVDNGGIPTFVGETDDRRAMGLAMYTRPSDGAFFAIVSRKFGVSGAYLWQYLLEDAGDGSIKATKVRAFGEFVGGKEIEAIAVDNELGYVYYSDEMAGIHKYLADPDAPEANTELAFFGTEGFAQDHEGISIYKINDGTGYILVSDQQANSFRVFKREGEADDPHNHQLVKVVAVSTNESDGSDVTSAVLDPRFPSGLFVAMSDNKTFHYYSWDDIAGDDLVKAPNGERMP
jgi:3-phytase